MAGSPHRFFAADALGLKAGAAIKTKAAGSETILQVRLRAAIPAKRRALTRVSIPRVPVSLADHLPKRRHELGWSQERTERELGLYKSKRCEWESGITPYAKSWPTIIRFLGYDPRKGEAEAAD